MKRLRIWWLKRRLRKAYLRYWYLFEGLDCGTGIASEISQKLWSIKDEVNRLLDKLGKLDPYAPQWRL